MKRIVQVICISGLMVLLLALAHRIWFGPEKFQIGARLPEGKVKPQLAGAGDEALLLAPDGSLWGWGGKATEVAALLPGRKSTPVPTRIGKDSDWKDISASSAFALGLKADGSLWGWGWNAAGQLGLAKSPGRPIDPIQIGTDTNWAHISAGAGHCLALKKDGSIWAWGQNDCGQVGDGTTNKVRTVTRIGEERDWKQISAGFFNSYALKKDGTIWGWGYSLASGKSENMLSPKEIDADTNWVAISAGEFHMAAIKSDGTLWLCGQNAHITASAFAKSSATNMIPVGTDRDWVEVDSSSNSFFARKKDGSWWVCGSDSFGRLGMRRHGVDMGAPRKLPFDFEPWAFHPGFQATVLLTPDGKLWSWGIRLGIPPPSSGTKKAKVFINGLYGHFRKNARLFRMEDEVTDDGPRLVWVLPEEVVGVK